MRKQLKSLLLVAFIAAVASPAWAQTPSTEGRDFWVTFLRAADDNPTELKLTISAREACEVTIENTNANYSTRQTVQDNSCTELVMARANSYSSTNESATYTALHVTATKDISLFAGNYRDKSFDATNVLPTSALLDDYLIQTYPPSDHENKPQGSHFAIIAVEDGTTVVDYELTAKTAGNKSGRQTATLKKGQVWYVWTGKNEGPDADLSGTTVKARDGKKIAVFQGCPHTNIPYSVRDRDHIISQAMPTAYWGTEFGITASRKHRRDIVSVMAINDGTVVYINTPDGDKEPIHTFNFSEDNKRYWTFEIGEYEAYCADNEGQSPSHGQLPPPQVVDSSCYLTTSCPVGVHLFMVSNRYDNAVPKVNSDTLVSDPAMVWVSPLEQVIKEINFATYKTAQVKFHFMNIITSTSNVPNMTWNGNNIAAHFHPLMGNNDYSYARIEIPHGSHNLKGAGGFLAHVYGYGERESYAYSCGSSTVQRSVSVGGVPLSIGEISTSNTFCVEEDLEMKLNLGNNDYQSVVWDFGDGITYSAGQNASSNDMKIAHHTYTTPGWYDLKVAVEYINTCQAATPAGSSGYFSETMILPIRVVRPDTILVVDTAYCFKPEEYAADPAKCDKLIAEGENEVVTDRDHCYDPVVIHHKHYGLSTEYEYTQSGDRDSSMVNGQWYYSSQDVHYTIPNSMGCDSVITCHLEVITCLGLNFPNNPEGQFACHGEGMTVPYSKWKGDIGEVHFVIPGVVDEKVEMSNDNTDTGLLALPTYKITVPGKYKAQIVVVDKWCDTLSFPLDIDVYYSKDIFKYKFNNVLAVYNKDENGKHVFSAFQWYFNGEPIMGASESIYHTDGQMPSGEYYVELTDKDGNKQRSCPQEIKPVDIDPEPAPAKKVLQNGHIYIQKDDSLYDIYGQRVQ